MDISTVSILDGNTFVVSDRRGDIEGKPGDEAGLFRADMRYLSRWVLTVDGKRPNVLSIDDFQYFCAQHFCALTTGTIYVDSHLSVTRRRAVAAGFFEHVLLKNHGHEPLDVLVRIEADADFADLFEVKDKLPKKGKIYHRVEKQRLVIGYERERFVRETWITPSAEAIVSEDGFTFSVHLPAHGSWSVDFDVRAVNNLRKPPVSATEARQTGAPDDARFETLTDWVKNAPRVVCDWEPLQQTYRRSINDLAALRFVSPLLPRRVMPAAGLPWFMAMFGRDSLITSYQALPFEPELARNTLSTLGALQARSVDHFRDAEPGKILHELRLGEMTAFEERPHSPYYGSADSTPLFLVLLEEYERWSGDREFVRGFEREVRQAIRWLDEYGDRDGDGYIEYERWEKTGLENQCWKDSWNSIVFANGEIAPLPRATCEIQGYAYDAKKRVARLARTVFEDPKWAEKLEREAETLKKKFNEDFWIPDRRFFALALDGQKRKVDALTSNIGHLLWSGIAERDKADACVKHLMSDALFSGWGVRTMAEGEGSYNPIGYHVGTVWPHDTSIIALGLRRYGYRTEAARLCKAILDASVYFRHRLPEAFAGFRRSETRFPVEYPTACSPQAWATGAPLLILRALLGLDAESGHLIVDPAIPHPLDQIELLDVPGAWGRTDAFGRAHIDVDVAA
jgi:glycogen debranching enzyme